MSTKVGILIVSDSCFSGQATDTSGENLKTLVENAGIWNDVATIKSVVPDEKDAIKDILIKWSDGEKVDLILTTGGTGFAPRDVTPEVTKDVIDREAPGLSIAMLKGSLEVTPMAMLSRPACGMRGSTLIVNLPGSKKGSQECFEFVKPALRHAIDLLKGKKKEVAKTHEIVQRTTTVPGFIQHSCSGTHEDIHPGHHHGQACHSHGENISGVDISKVAHRPRESPYPLVNVEEAIKNVLEEVKIQDSENINFKDALHRVLADDVFANDNLPPFPASIKDGYAVLTADGAGPRKVLGDATAGFKPICEVIAGYCVRISTGAPLPKGADAVVQVEDTDLLKDADGGNEELEVYINKAPKLGQDIRPIGSDIKAGEKLLAEGQILGAPELGLLATVGCVDIKCVKLPIVGVMSTGTELVEPGQRLGPGQIWDANRTTLTYAIKEQGFPVVDLGIAPDSTESLVKHLKDGLNKVDVIVTSGGVSMGEKDLLKDVLLVDFMAKIHFARVFMKPGKPTTFATVKHNSKKLLFCLPGNPVSAVVTCNLYVLPALRKMAGHKQPMCPVVKARLSIDVRLDPRPEYHRCKLTWHKDNPVPLAESTGNQISSRLLSMKSANALMMLPPRSSEIIQLSAGTLVDCMLL